MRNTGNLQRRYLELFTVKACPAALLLIILVMSAGAQIQQKPTPLKPTRTGQSRHVEATPAAKIFGCLSRPADAVMTARKNADGSYSGHVYSNGTAYASDANDCEYFIADVILPHGFKVSAQYTQNAVTISGGVDPTGLTESLCALASYRTIIYVKSHTLEASGFRKTHDINPHGVWFAEGGLNLCQFPTETAESLQVDIPEAGVVVPSTYRVLVLPKVNGQARQVTVRWGAVQIVT